MQNVFIALSRLIIAEVTEKHQEREGMLAIDLEIKTLATGVNEQSASTTLGLQGASVV